jgi:hypothetical protein
VAVLPLRLLIAAPQLREFLFLTAGQPVTAAVVIGAGLSHPVPQARPADIRAFGDLRYRTVALTSQFDRALPKLGGCGAG